MNEKSRETNKNNLTKLQIVVSSRFVKHLRTGRENAKTARALAAELGTDTRHVQQLAELARRCGFPVLASCDEHPGYYLGTDAQEVQVYCRRLHHRAGEIHKTRSELLRNLKHWNFEKQQHDFEIVTAEEAPHDDE